jgi:hypothetical protein
MWIFPTAASLLLISAVVGGFFAPYRMGRTSDTRKIAIVFVGSQTPQAASPGQ